MEWIKDKKYSLLKSTYSSELLACQKIRNWREDKKRLKFKGKTSCAIAYVIFHASVFSCCNCSRTLKTPSSMVIFEVAVYGGLNKNGSHGLRFECLVTREWPYLRRIRRCSLVAEVKEDWRELVCFGHDRAPCTHGLIASAVAWQRPPQEKAGQQSNRKGEGNSWASTPNWGHIHHWWLLEEEKSVFFRPVRLTRF